MKRSQEHSLRRFFASRIFLIIALIVAVFVAFGFARAYFQDYRVRKEIAALEDEVRRLEKKRFESLELLEYVQTGDYVEKQARTQLNLKQPGENVVFIKDLTTSAERNSGEAERSEVKPLNNPQKWWYYITHQPLEHQ